MLISRDCALTLTELGHRMLVAPHRKLEKTAEALQPSSTTTSGANPAIAGVAVGQISRACCAARPLQDGAGC